MKQLHLSIPRPCHESWGAMTPAEKGKFCAACQKTVVDFTNMSDRQLAEFFRKPKGSVCGHFYSDQLDRDIAIPAKRIPWVKYFFQFTWPAWMLFLKSCGDRSTAGVVKAKQEMTSVPPPPPAPGNVVRTIGDTVVQLLPDTLAVSGFKKIECSTTMGYIMPGQEIDTSKHTGEVMNGGISVSRPIFGNVAFLKVQKPDSLEKKNKKQRTTSIESEALVQSIEPQPTTPRNLPSANTVDSNSVYSITSGALVSIIDFKRPSLCKAFKRMITASTKTPAMARITVYPNPLPANTAFKISLKKMEPGSYALHLINGAGQILQTTELTVQETQQTFGIVPPSLIAGIYFLRIQNLKTGKSYTEKLVVE